MKTLDARAEALQALLLDDPGIKTTLEECRELIIADFIEQLRARSQNPARALT